DGILPDSPTVQCTLAVLLAEDARLDQAEAELKEVVESGAMKDFVHVFRAAYLGASRPQSNLGVTALQPEWARDKLELRLASRFNPSSSSSIQARLLSRGKRWTMRVTVLCVLSLILVGGGLVTTARWAWRRQLPAPIAEGITVGAWLVKDGYAVVV